MKKILINFGILPLEFENPKDYDSIYPGDLLTCGITPPCTGSAKGAIPRKISAPS